MRLISQIEMLYKCSYSVRKRKLIALEHFKEILYISRLKKHLTLRGRFTVPEVFYFASDTFRFWPVFIA